jgi:hypothetical protein
MCRNIPPMKELWSYYFGAVGDRNKQIYIRSLPLLNNNIPSIPIPLPSMYVYTYDKVCFVII